MTLAPKVPAQTLYHRRESFDDEDYSLNFNDNDETTSENLNAAINSLLDLNNDLIYEDNFEGSRPNTTGNCAANDRPILTTSSARSRSKMSTYSDGDVQAGINGAEDVNDVLWDDDTSRPESITVVSDVWNNSGNGGRKSRWPNNQLWIQKGRGFELRNRATINPRGRKNIPEFKKWVFFEWQWLWRL